MRTQPQQYAILFPSFSFIFCLLFIHYRLFLYQLSVGAWIGIGIALAAAVVLVIVLSVFMYKRLTKVPKSHHLCNLTCRWIIITIRRHHQRVISLILSLIDVLNALKKDLAFIATFFSLYMKFNVIESNAFFQFM